jgi:hypothetical protein
VQCRHAARTGATARQALEVAHDVVGAVPDQAAGERHAGDLGLRCLPQAGAQPLEQFGSRRRHAAALATDREPGLIETHLQGVPEADERVAPEPLASLHALQQEARREGRQFHERRDRRVQVTGDIEQRLQRVAPFRTGNKKPIPVIRRWVSGIPQVLNRQKTANRQPTPL